MKDFRDYLTEASLQRIEEMKTPNWPKKFEKERFKAIDKGFALWDAYNKLKTSYESKIKSLKESPQYASGDDQVKKIVKYLEEALSDLSKEIDDLLTASEKESFEKSKGDKIYKKIISADERKSISSTLKNLTMRVLGMGDISDRLAEKIQADAKQFMYRIPGYHKYYNNEKEI